MREHPLCVFCLAQGKVVPAKVADHVHKHHGDPTQFFAGELQSLCWQCHASRKYGIEVRGYDNTIGLDGWPCDKAHPSYLKTLRSVRQPAEPEPPPPPPKLGPMIG
jgi:hypothetical protein